MYHEKNTFSISAQCSMTDSGIRVNKSDSLAVKEKKANRPRNFTRGAASGMLRAQVEKKALTEELTHCFSYVRGECNLTQPDLHLPQPRPLKSKSKLHQSFVTIPQGRI